MRRSCMESVDEPCISFASPLKWPAPVGKLRQDHQREPQLKFNAHAYDYDFFRGQNGGVEL